MELLDMQENMKELTDCLLDLYNKYPEECKAILMEISEIGNELNDIEKELEEIEEDLKNHEIY